MDEGTLSLVTEIVSAYVSNNTLNTDSLPGLIRSVYTALTSLGQPVLETVENVVQKPAISPKKSVTPDYIVCLEDGKKLKMLKRHLAQLGLTPEAYREKWGLPSDYPMIAPNYAKMRSDMAVKLGLGRKAA